MQFLKSSIRFLFSPAFIAITLGLCLPIFKDFTWLISYMLMLILFFGFLEIEDYKIFVLNKDVIKLILSILIIAILVFLLLLPFSKDLAVVALLMGLTPTALASPAITKRIGKDVKIVAVNILYTNLLSSIFFPLAFYLTYKNSELNINYLAPLLKTLIMVILPFTLTFLINKYLKTSLKPKLLKLSEYTIILWFSILLIGSSAAGARIRMAGVGILMLILVLGVTLIIILINYIVGFNLHKTKKVEFAQSLFQKNTMFAVWFALQFLPPIVSIAPIFYAILQNIVLVLLLIKYRVSPVIPA